MKINIEDEEFIFDEFFKVKKAYLTHELYNGSMSEPLIRYSVDKKDGVAILVVDDENQEIILVEQFRYPMSSWLLEIVAGQLESNESIESAAHREVLEETGLSLNKLISLGEFYVSPGLISEKVYLYQGHIDKSKKAVDTDPIKDEGEDIKLVRVPFHEIKNIISSKKLEDAKTLVALCRFVINNEIIVKS